MTKKWYFTIFIFLLVISLYFQTKTIYGGDAGELVTAAFTGGIPHAPGFPLYILLSSILIKIVPLFTIAWRVSLMSVIPSVLARIVLLALLYRLTRSKLLSIMSVLVYSFLYPVWLFTEVPEVISLNIFFLVSCLYLAYKAYDTTKLKYLLFLALIFGIAFFHNYIIVLAAPGLFYLVTRKIKIRILRKSIVKYLLLFGVGVLPYIYFTLTSLQRPLLDSSHPTNLINLLNLITRANFGTFRLSSGYYFNLQSGLSGFFTFLNFIFFDFRLLGIAFILFGIFYSVKRRSPEYIFLLINLVVFAGFFVYASFPLFLDFSLGTFEKYLPMVYIYLLLFFALGAKFALIKLHTLKAPLFKTVAVCAVIITLLGFIAILFRNNYRRILILRNDFTAENLGKDILTSVPKGGILNLTSDTAYYNTLYVHFVLGVRPDIKIVRFNQLNNYEYKQTLRKQYPDLILPEESVYVDRALEAFLMDNYQKFSIINDLPSPLNTYTWLPQGLLWKYYPESVKKYPSPAELETSNLTIWVQYHSPLSGVLSRYQSLLLNDVLRIYAMGHQSFGIMLFKNQQYTLALNEFNDSLNEWPQFVGAYIYSAQAHIKLGECSKSITSLDKAVEINPTKTDIYKYYIDTYTNCYHNETKAQYYYKLYQKWKRKEQL